MTDTFRAIILGIIQGLTEFLPISSTGHMILAEPLLGIKEGTISVDQVNFWRDVFDIFIHLGTIMAVVLYFWKILWQQTLKIDRTQPIYEHFLVKLFVAFLPAAIVGKLFHRQIEEYLKTPPIIAGALIVGGILIILIERRVKWPRFNSAASVPLLTAFLIGVAQCFGMIPGTSRSAATIMGALLLGLSPLAAAEFSFFLAIPTMFAAGFFSLFKHRHEIHAEQVNLLGLGFFVSFLVALLVVASFMQYIRTHKFTPFAYYRIVLGAIVIAVLFAKPGWFG